MRFYGVGALKSTQETRLRTEDIILPYFVVEGEGIRRPIRSMPGIYHLSVDNLIKGISGLRGVRYILLFGLPKEKDENGSEAYKSNGVIQKAVRAVKQRFKDLIVITDVCLCAYTSHGHCRILRSGNDELDVDTDETLETLARTAISHAEAGADFVAPSAMMPGQVKAIREALDGRSFENTKILAYSAKYASNLYGPFREALDSAPRFGDRTGYQLDFKNTDEALERIGKDIEEGADIVMVKPALPYLDVICKAKERFDVPVAAYSVSGEYSMIKRLSAGDKAVEQKLALEVLTSIKRAGADLIISYFGKEVDKWLR